MSDPDRTRRRRVNLELPLSLLEKIDSLKAEWGLRNRGDILERLLKEIFTLPESEDEPGDAADSDPSRRDEPSQPIGALVLLRRDGSGELVCDFDAEEPLQSPRVPPTAGRGGGIDLPGFVRRQSRELKRSLQPPSRPSSHDDPLPQLDPVALERALRHADEHWREIYGNSPSEAVLEAAMVWLADDIWPHSELSEGRPFTWSLANSVMQRLTPAWTTAPASFERVMVMAGVLEDPFSADTLEMRQPTMIRRFVQRFRRRRRGMSFETLAHTMTLHGALRMLNLPTAPGHRLTLEQIREAYRELALANHPDSGGCDQTMRRLNEAYQLLKELYRRQ